VVPVYVPTSTLPPRSPKPDIILFCHGGYVLGSCFIVFGQIAVQSDGFQLIPYYPTLDPILLPRQNFGASLLDSLLRQIPDMFGFGVGGLSSSDHFL